MQHFERLDQLPELSGGEEALGVRRPPALGPLGFQKRLDDEESARDQTIDDVRHPSSVQVVEHQDHIEHPKVRPGLFEIGFDPTDGDTGGRAHPTRDGEPRRIAVHPDDGRTEGGGGDAMTTDATRHVEHPGTRANPAGMPPKPDTRPAADLKRKRSMFEAQSGHSPRRVVLADLARTQYQVMVIGGGITGASIARDAAMRGLSTLLIEQHDVASGTSSRSSRLVHGGLRYLEQREFRLVFEALRERRTWLRIAPHLVRAQAFVLPSRQGDRVPGWKIRLGLWLYDRLARTGNLPLHRNLSKREVMTLEPGLDSTGLRDGALYYDAQCDDARLTIAIARSAAYYGAVVRNYTAVTGLTHQAGRVVGATLCDRETGEHAPVPARVIVNATGPWSDQVRKLDSPGQAQLLRPTKGVHILVPRARLGNRHGITFTSAIDGRVMFVLPWNEQAYVGTTDTDTSETPDTVSAQAEDVAYLLRSANALYPAARLTEADVLATWAGLRPLLAGSPTDPTSSISREHRLECSSTGLLTIAGGKLTTARSMAAEVLSAVERLLGQTRRAREKTRDPAQVRLPGGESISDQEIRSAFRTGPVNDHLLVHLRSHYGSEAREIGALCNESPSLFAPMHPAHPALLAEAVFATRYEWARRVEDVLVRRVHVFYETKDHGMQARDRVAGIMAHELGWDANQERNEAEKFGDFAAGASSHSDG